MQRIKALFRARAIETPGTAVYKSQTRKEWIEKLPDKGVRFRLTALYAEMDVVSELRPKAKAAMVEEARRDPTWKMLQSVPFFGPVRGSLILAIMKTPWRFRTKRNVWGYAGLAVVTVSSGDHKVVAGKLVRRKRPPMTRGPESESQPRAQGRVQGGGHSGGPERQKSWCGSLTPRTAPRSGTKVRGEVS